LALKLAVASGKGGTGKTTVAIALAIAANNATLLDCDVEAPNVHLFFPDAPNREEGVSMPIPQVDMDKCDGCRLCSEFCQFNALAVFPGQTLVFPELCHSCGGCRLVCPKHAIMEIDRPIGKIVFGSSRGINWIQGRLDIGQPMSPPLIRAVLAHEGEGLTLIDAPPGTSCPMVSAVGGADYVLLVTEPTPFGHNDLVLAVDTVKQLGRPFGVIINRADGGDDRIVRYCEEEGIRIWLRIPVDRHLAEVYATGGSLLDAMPEYRPLLEGLLSDITALHAGGTR
jgi:MinD superfamily P-loop ATPase